MLQIRKDFFCGITINKYNGAIKKSLKQCYRIIAHVKLKLIELTLSNAILANEAQIKLTFARNFASSRCYH